MTCRLLLRTKGVDLYHCSPGQASVGCRQPSYATSPRVKDFRCPAADDGATHIVGGVGKPTGNEPARYGSQLDRQVVELVPAYCGARGRLAGANWQER